MKTVSLLQFRRDAEGVLRKVQRGQRFVLTYRGKPVARLEPIPAAKISADDPFYTLCELADTNIEPLTNEEIDRIVYGI